MQKRFTLAALECLFDLGATVVYAIIAGLLIVGIVASDDGSMSVVSTLLYASILPGAVLLLIGFELVGRVVAEWRTLRQEDGARRGRFQMAQPVAVRAQ